MATVFEKAPNGFLDKTAGMKLRKEIYAPGGSRDIDVSIHNFLGRDRSIQPYLKTLGIETPAKPKGGPSKEAAPPTRRSKPSAPKFVILSRADGEGLRECDSASSNESAKHRLQFASVPAPALAPTRDDMKSERFRAKVATP